MTQAVIEIGGVPGSDTDWTINTLVQFSNFDSGGETTYLWSLLDQPAGPADSLSLPNVENPTLTPKKEGTYLVELIVNLGLPDEARDRVVLAVRQLKTRERIPAAGEATEADLARGWAADMNALLNRIDGLLSDSTIVVGVNSSGGFLAHGEVVRATSGVVIKSGLPGQETLPGFVKAPATTLGSVDELLCVVESDVDGNLNVAAGALVKVRYLGRCAALPLGGGAVGDVVYVSDTATIAIVAGTVKRQVGSIMAISGGSYDVWFDGVGGANITPINVPYVVYGSPGNLTNPHRIDGNNAQGAIGGVPHVFQAGDDGTIALIAKRFSAVGLSPLQVQTELGAVLAEFDVAGQLLMGAHRIKNVDDSSPGFSTTDVPTRKYVDTQTRCLFPNNLIMNGAFEIWQRPAPGPIATHPNVTFSHDRWYSRSSLVANAVSVSPQYIPLTGVVSPHRGRWTKGNSASSQTFYTEQYIYAGGDLLSLRRATVLGNNRFEVSFYVNTGAGWTGTGLGVRVSANGTEILGDFAITGTGIKRFVTAVLPTSVASPSLTLRFYWTWPAGNVANDFVEFTDVMLLALAVDSPYSETFLPFMRYAKSYSSELHECMRFYETSSGYPVGTPTLDGALRGVHGAGTANNSPWSMPQPRFLVPKIGSSPTIWIWGANGTANVWWIAGSFRASSATDVNARGFSVYNATGSTVNTTGETHGHWAAQTETYL